MIVRALDINGDWTFGKGRNNYLSGNAAIVQDISLRLKSFLGDCFFAIDEGIDWFNLLGSKNQVALELAVRSVILGTEGVVKLIDAQVTLEEESRRINMRFIVSTVYTAALNTANVVGTTSLLLTESGDVLTTESGSPIAAG